MLRRIDVTEKSFYVQSISNMNRRNTALDLTTWMTEKQIIDQDLGDALGVTRSYVNRVRRGEVHPSLGFALSVHDYTGGEVELRQLLPRHMRPGFKQPETPRTPKGSARKPAERKASRTRATA